MTLKTVSRYNPDKVSSVGDQAIVLGGSIAGFCTGRVLADGFEEVVILERDPLANVSLHDDCQFITYRATDSGDRVTGVEIRDETGDEVEFDANLVVDATGRTSRTPTFSINTAIGNLPSTKLPLM